MILRQLKSLLNALTDEEIEELELCANDNRKIVGILVDNYSINLMTENVLIKVQEKVFTGDLDEDAPFYE